MSENLSLRPYKPEEFERACEIRNLTKESSKERFYKGFSASGSWSDHYQHLAVDLNGELIGDVQLRKCDFTRPEGAWDMGIEISPELQGKGLGTRALGLVAEYVFSNGAHRVEGSTDESNLAMRRAFEKADWHFEGTLKNLFIDAGVGRDYLSFTKTI